MIAGIDLGGTQVRLTLGRSDGRIDHSVRTRTAQLGTPGGLAEWASQHVTQSRGRVAPVMEQVLRASPFIGPARRPRLRRGRLGDRAGQVGAVEWALTHL
jgi:hypothetical protein